MVRAGLPSGSLRLQTVEPLDMTMKTRPLFCLAGITLAATTMFAPSARATEIALDDVKCVVAPRDAKADKSADYKEGQVFFCCGNCEAKFKAAPEKFAVSANQQLVATKQYEQTACPITGQKLNPKMNLTVDGVEVGFCCGKCKAAVAAAEGEKQTEMVFGEKAFAKGFAKAKDEEARTK